MSQLPTSPFPNIYIDNFCVEVFEKTISRTYVIDHSFERKFNGVCFRLC